LIPLDPTAGGGETLEGEIDIVMRSALAKIDR
jgi:hypothetical protein